MDNYIVVQLKDIAKERGIRGYYNLRKVQLIHVLEAARLVELKSNIFDESIPNDPTPGLQPTHWRPSNSRQKLCKIKIKNLYKGYTKRLNILVNGC